MAFEDIDRAGLFKRYRRSEISSQAMLNFLDGINEDYGRILFFTANKPDRILDKPAYVRPGCIDQIVEIGFVDRNQLCRMFAHFYDDIDAKTFEEEHKLKLDVLINTVYERNKSQAKRRKFKNGIPPAKIVEIMWMHQENANDAIQALIDHYNVQEDVSKAEGGGNQNKDKHVLKQQRTTGRPRNPTKSAIFKNTVALKKLKEVMHRNKRNLTGAINQMLKKEMKARSANLLGTTPKQNTDEKLDAMKQNVHILAYKIARRVYDTSVTNYNEAKEKSEIKNKERYQKAIALWQKKLTAWKATRGNRKTKPRVRRRRSKPPILNKLTKLERQHALLRRSLPDVRMTAPVKQVRCHDDML